MPHLQDDAQPRHMTLAAQRRQEDVEAWQIGPEVPGQLEQHRTQLGTQATGADEQTPEGIGRSLQLPESLLTRRPHRSEEPSGTAHPPKRATASLRVCENLPRK